jgi:hypothetical protein
MPKNNRCSLVSARTRAIRLTPNPRPVQVQSHAEARAPHRVEKFSDSAQDSGTVFSAAAASGERLFQFYNSGVWRTEREVQAIVHEHACFELDEASAVGDVLSYETLLQLDRSLFKWHGPKAAHCQLNAFRTAPPDPGSAGIARWGLSWELPAGVLDRLGAAAVAAALAPVERAFAGEIRDAGVAPGALGLQCYVPGAVNALSGEKVRAPAMYDHQDRMFLDGQTRSCITSVQERPDDAWFLTIKRIKKEGLEFVKDVRMVDGRRRAFGPEENWHFTHGVRAGTAGRFSLCIFGAPSGGDR